MVPRLIFYSSHRMALHESLSHFLFQALKRVSNDAENLMERELADTKRLTVSLPPDVPAAQRERGRSGGKTVLTTGLLCSR